MHTENCLPSGSGKQTRPQRTAKVSFVIGAATVREMYVLGESNSQQLLSLLNYVWLKASVSQSVSQSVGWLQKGQLE